MTGRSTWLTGAAVALATTMMMSDFAHADSWRRAQRRALRNGYVGVQFGGHGYGGGYGNAGYSQACPCECGPAGQGQPVNGQPLDQHGQPYSAGRPIYDQGVQGQGVQGGHQPNLIDGAIDPGQQPRSGQYFPAQQNQNLNLNLNGRVQSDLPGGDVNGARQNQPPMNPQSRELNNQIQNSVDGLSN